MTMVEITHKCGHTSQVAGHLLGRGAARQKRITERGQYLCADCFNNNLRETAAKLTRIDGTPYTAEEQAAYVAKRERK